MKYYLAKTEPDGYSIDRFANDKFTSWNGVNNPQAVNFLKQMQPKDLVLIYHTQNERAIVGLAEVIGNSRPDPDNSRSWLVDMKFIRKFEPPWVSLHEIKSSGEFSDFRLVRQSRLSVMDVPEKFIQYLKKKGVL